MIRGRCQWRLRVQLGPRHGHLSPPFKGPQKPWYPSGTLFPFLGGFKVPELCSSEANVLLKFGT